METTLLLLLLCLFLCNAVAGLEKTPPQKTTSQAAASGRAIAILRESRYLRCPAAPPRANSSVTFTAKSQLECAIRCSQSERCYGTTMCPQEGGDRLVCEMRSDLPQGQCPQVSQPLAGCYFIQEEEGLTTAPPTTTLANEATTEKTEATTGPDTTTTQLLCQNGGKQVNGSQCHCPLPYAGKICQRYMRDCSEGFDQGYNNKSFDGEYLIQPVTSPTPFMVTCIFLWGGITYPFHRKYSPSDPWSTKSWTEVKNGFGTSPAGIPDKENFFIGLDRLHELLSQALYTNHIFSTYNGNQLASAFYRNFTVGPESLGYELKYSDFFWRDNPSDDGLLVNAGPIMFSTMDHNTNGCASLRGSAGWYGSGDCRGFSMFADPVLWPVNSVRWPVETMRFKLSRWSKFCAE